MAGIRLDRQIDLDLTGHIPTQVHLAQGLGLVGKVEDDRAGQFVVGHASAIGRFEDVDTVPFAGALTAGGDA